MLKSKRVFPLALVFIFVCSFVFTFTTIPVFAAGSVSVDYTSTTGTGSQYLFGGTHTPNLSHTDAWDKLFNAGCNYIRNDVRPQLIVPSNITLSDYQGNVNNCANPSTWNFTYVDNWLSKAKQYGAKTMALIFEKPAWLTYDGTVHGVPKDWNVYEDIIKKIYQHIQSNTDYVEFNNEMKNSVFFNITGSPYTDWKVASDDQFYHGVHAVRSVSTTVQVGGVAESTCSDEGDLGVILGDSRLGSNDINFLTFHDYDTAPVHYDNIQNLRNLVISKGRNGNMPMICDEWNYTAQAVTTPDTLVQGDRSGSYHGYRLIRFAKYGWNMDGYYDFSPWNMNNDQGWTETLGVYSWSGSAATMNESMRTWLVYAKKMGLGSGAFQMKSTSFPGTTEALGAVNSSGTPLVLAVNDNNYANTLNFTLTGLQNASNITVQIYMPSPSNDGSSPYQTLSNQVISNNQYTVSVNMPAYSSVGILLQGAQVGTSSTVTVDDTNSSIIYSSTWTAGTYASCYNGTQHTTNTANNYAQFTFNGTSITWIGAKWNNRGYTDVYIDGVLQTTVDAYDPSNQIQQVLYQKSGLSSGSHTIKLVCKGTKDTGAYDCVTDVDAFEYTP